MASSNFLCTISLKDKTSLYLTRLYKLQEGGGVYRCANLNVSQARPPAGICIPPRIHRAATSSEDLDSGVALPTPGGFIHTYIYLPTFSSGPFKHNPLPSSICSLSLIYSNQCWGSGSTGSACVRASWIRILSFSHKGVE